MTIKDLAIECCTLAPGGSKTKILSYINKNYAPHKTNQQYLYPLLDRLVERGLLERQDDYYFNVQEKDSKEKASKEAESDSKEAESKEDSKDEEGDD